MTFELAKSFRFESAHYLPRVPPGHKCGSMHGHSYQCIVYVAGELDLSLGWVVDFATITEACEPLRRALDHHVLNDIDGLDNPTSEVLAAWVWHRLAPKLPGLTRVEISETDASSCSYTGPGSRR